MKKFFSFVLASLMSVAMFGQNLELSLAQLGDSENGGMSWGTVSNANGVVTFGSAWECGIGWYFNGGEDWSNYHAVVAEIEPFSGQVALNVAYADEGEYKQVIATAGQTTIRVELDERKSHVFKVYFQSGKMGNMTIKRVYVEGGDDPYDISNKVEVPIVYEEGENCVKIFQDELEAHNPGDVVVIRLNCLSAEKLQGYGIAKLVAMDDWYNAQLEIMNAIDGVGEADYKYLISELISVAKQGGDTWYIGPDSEVAGCILNTYANESEVVSIKCYSANASAIEEVPADMVGKTFKKIENGQVVIIRDGVKFNALGARAL